MVLEQVTAGRGFYPSGFGMFWSLEAFHAMPHRFIATLRCGEASWCTKVCLKSRSDAILPGKAPKDLASHEQPGTMVFFFFNRRALM